MIQVELVPRQPATTVLAGGLVTGIDIVAAEPDLPLGHAVVLDQEHDPWHTHHMVDQSHGFLVDRNRKVAPPLEVEGLVSFVDHPGDAQVEQREGSAYRRDVYREIRTIQHQHLCVHRGTAHGDAPWTACLKCTGIHKGPRLNQEELRNLSSAGRLVKHTSRRTSTCHFASTGLSSTLSRVRTASFRTAYYHVVTYRLNRGADALFHFSESATN